MTEFSTNTIEQSPASKSNSSSASPEIFQILYNLQVNVPTMHCLIGFNSPTLCTVLFYLLFNYSVSYMFRHLGCHLQGASFPYELLKYICPRAVSLYMNVVMYWMLRSHVLGSPG
jgi:hypothetical protein